MGTTLTGTTPQDTYDSLIKVTDNGPIGATAKYLSDGLGNDSALALSTGNIGIGTTSPSRNLHILGGAGIGTVLKLEAGSGAVTYLQLAYNGATNAQSGYISYDSSANMGLFTNDNEKVRITSTGNVGIGTSSPVGKLHVEGVASGQAIRLNHSASNSFIYSTIANANAIAFDNLSGALAIYTGGAERLRVLSTGGLTFNGDTAAANALDDYEEGTFTPTIAYSTSGTPTYAVQNGVYTKIGRSVQAQIVLSWNENGAVGDITIQGLPFTSVNTYRSIPSIMSFGLTGLPTAISVTGIVFGNSTSISLFLNDNAATTLTEAYTDNDQDIYVTVTYQAA